MIHLHCEQRVTGHATTPIYRRGDRGVGVTRNLSGRESSSRATSSPIGSISPEDSAVGIAMGSAYGAYVKGGMETQLLGKGE